jgi:flagellar protein FliO/FliZ
MDALFGTSMPLAARFFIAFLVVLALIGVTAWLVRRFGANRLGTSARGRQPRLAVIDAASVDSRRRLVLIRRDNTEHLLMIGGPTDVVIEPNIVRASNAREATREVGREPGRLSMEPPRLAPAPEPTWQPPASEQPPPPMPSQRSGHRTTPPADEPWLQPAEPAPRVRHSDSLTGLAAELSAKLHSAELPAPPPARSEPPAPPPAPPRTAAPPVTPEPPPPRTAAPPVTPEPPPPPPPPPAQNDHNLAEMAQQLEAALRRAPVPEGRPPVTDPLAMTPPPKPTPKPPSQRNGSGAHEFKPARPEPRFEPKFEQKFEPKPEARLEPKHEPKFEPRFEPRREPRAEAKAEPKFEPALDDKFDAKFDAKPEPRFDFKAQPRPEPAMASSSKSIYDNLEEEMASLLGRPPDKS